MLDARLDNASSFKSHKAQLDEGRTHGCLQLFRKVQVYLDGLCAGPAMRMHGIHYFQLRLLRKYRRCKSLWSPQPLQELPRRC